jgi:hypothetical protein
MFRFDAAGKGVYGWMFVFLGFVKALAAGENQVSGPEEFSL